MVARGGGNAEGKTPRGLGHLGYVWSMSRYAVAWAIPSRLAPAPLAELLASLAPDERERAAAFAFDEDRLAFAVAHGLLRRVLSSHAEGAPSHWRFARSGAGKPQLVAAGRAGDLAFSLAHTRSLVACAVTRAGAIGIDVEPVASVAPEPAVVAHCCARSERAALERLDAQAAAKAFARLWTMKEAVVKALGAGLDLPYTAIECALDPPRLVRIDAAEVPSARWSIATTVPVAGHVMTVARSTARLDRTA